MTSMTMSKAFPEGKAKATKIEEDTFLVSFSGVHFVLHLIDEAIHFYTPDVIFTGRGDAVQIDVKRSLAGTCVMDIMAGVDKNGELLMVPENEEQAETYISVALDQAVGDASAQTEEVLKTLGRLACAYCNETHLKFTVIKGGLTLFFFGLEKFVTFKGLGANDVFGKRIMRLRHLSANGRLISEADRIVFAFTPEETKDKSTHHKFDMSNQFIGLANDAGFDGESIFAEFQKVL